jgi:hypothetical protein
MVNKIRISQQKPDSIIMPEAGFALSRFDKPLRRPPQPRPLLAEHVRSALDDSISDRFASQKTTGQRIGEFPHEAERRSPSTNQTGREGLRVQRSYLHATNLQIYKLPWGNPREAKATANSQSHRLEALRRDS